MTDRQRRARRERRLQHQGHARHRLIVTSGATGFAVVATLVSGSAAHAATGVSVVVDSLNGANSNASALQPAGQENLSDAIAYVNASGGAGTITFASTLSGHTIDLTNSLPAIEQSLTVVGPGQSNLAISGQDQDNEIFGGSVGDINVSGLTLEDVEDTASYNNVAAVANYSGSVELTDSTVKDLVASTAYYGYTNGIIGDEVTLSGDTLTDNGTNPALIQAYDGNGQSTLTGVTATNNTSVRDAVIEARGGSLTISNSAFAHNSAYGGALETDTTNLTVTHSAFTDNASSYDGGALRVFGTGSTSADVEDSTFSGNTAVTSGGAIFLHDTPLTVAGSTFSGNSAGQAATGPDPGQNGVGGAISTRGTASRPAPVTVVNSTVTGNSAVFAPAGGGLSPRGGGIFLGRYSGLTATGDTIDANTATGPDAGGGIYASGAVDGAITLSDSVVAANTAATDPDLDLGSASAATAKSSLVGVGDAADVGAGTLTVDTSDQAGTLAAPLNPRLGALADNASPVTTPAGPVQTQQPAATSPLINSGDAANFSTQANPFSTDELGNPRPVTFTGVAISHGGDGADIGAVELPNPAPVMTTTTTAPTPTPTPTTATPPPAAPPAPRPLPAPPHQPAPLQHHLSAHVRDQFISLSWAYAQTGSSTFVLHYTSYPIGNGLDHMRLGRVHYYLDRSTKPVLTNHGGNTVVPLKGLGTGKHTIRVQSVYREYKADGQQVIVLKSLVIPITVPLTT